MKLLDLFCGAGGAWAAMVARDRDTLKRITSNYAMRRINGVCADCGDWLCASIEGCDGAGTAIAQNVSSGRSNV